MALAIVCTLTIGAQEGTRPLTGNLNYIYPDLNYFGKTQSTNLAAKTNTGNLSIPFFDDFYYATTSNYASQAFWIDSTVYINAGMPKAPLSIGVATFDGLNKKGYPYNPNQSFTASQANAADTLTSKPINLFTSNSLTLQPSDSVALIFYYQLTGNGDSPEVQDSLMVDMYQAAQAKWKNRVWALRGNTTSNNNDTVFKRAFVWITDTSLFHDGFKFRFRNKAATNGNYDNWHVDYVFLDKNRSMLGDTLWNDLALGYVPSPFLKEYAAMPYNQYTEADRATFYSNYIRYNGTSTVNTTYGHKIYDKNNIEVSSETFGASNLPPFRTGGWQHNPVHALPSISYTFPVMTDSADYTIKHFMNSIPGDISIGNDTVYHKQAFRNYFAYDDGSCETGYYVMGTGGRMAYKYVLHTLDTLRALRIYFDPVGSLSLVESSYKLKINVFDDSGFGPGNNKLFVSDSIYPKYSKSGHNAYYEYKLKTPFVMSQGTYYIGFQQFVAAGVTIGFDRNYDFSKNLFYDSGSGWTQSSVKGSVMMRPVFGKKIDPPVGVKELFATNESNVIIYPNPASSELFIGKNNANDYAIYNMNGSLIKQGKIVEDKTRIDCENLSNGIYILMLSSQNKVSYRQKLMIQH